MSRGRKEEGQGKRWEEEEEEEEEDGLGSDKLIAV